MLLWMITLPIDITQKKFKTEKASDSCMYKFKLESNGDKKMQRRDKTSIPFFTFFN